MREEIVKEAYSWYLTPYHHQARVKLVGVDCAQFVAGVAENSGIIKGPINTGTYSVEWHLHNKEEKMLEILESFGCNEVQLDNKQPGDILCFQFGRVCSHLGILVSETRFMHARIDIGKVVVNELSGDWIRRLKKVYQFPNIGE